MLSFVYGNTKFPEDARDFKIEGRVIVQFVVLKDGYISDHIKIINEPSEILIEAVMDVMELLQNKELWIPAEKEGEKVNILYTLPIKFSFQN